MLYKRVYTSTKGRLHLTNFFFIFSTKRLISVVCLVYVFKLSSVRRTKRASVHDNSIVYGCFADFSCAD